MQKSPEICIPFIFSPTAPCPSPLPPSRPLTAPPSCQTLPGLLTAFSPLFSIFFSKSINFLYCLVIKKMIVKLLRKKGHARSTYWRLQLSRDRQLSFLFKFPALCFWFWIAEGNCYYIYMFQPFFCRFFIWLVIFWRIWFLFCKSIHVGENKPHK